MWAVPPPAAAPPVKSLSRSLVVVLFARRRAALRVGRGCPHGRPLGRWGRAQAGGPGRRRRDRTRRRSRRGEGPRRALWHAVWRTALGAWRRTAVRALIEAGRAALCRGRLPLCAAGNGCRLRLAPSPEPRPAGRARDGSIAGGRAAGGFASTLVAGPGDDGPPDDGPPGRASAGARFGSGVCVRKDWLWPVGRPRSGLSRPMSRPGVRSGSIAAGR